MKRTLFTCTCGSLEHSLVVTSEDDEYLFVEVHLAPLPFWRRVRNAVRYVFGRRSPWGDFEEVVFTPYEALNLADSLLEWSGGQSYVFPTNDVH